MCKKKRKEREPGQGGRFVCSITGFKTLKADASVIKVGLHQKPLQMKESYLPYADV